MVFRIYKFVLGNHCEKCRPCYLMAIIPNLGGLAISQCIFLLRSINIVQCLQLKLYYAKFV